jgi:hypothetical protein
MDIKNRHKYAHLYDRLAYKIIAILEMSDLQYLAISRRQDRFLMGTIGAFWVPKKEYDEDADDSRQNRDKDKAQIEEKEGQTTANHYKRQAFLCKRPFIVNARLVQFSKKDVSFPKSRQRRPRILSI